jgi:hypothetical protein
MFHEVMGPLEGDINAGRVVTGIRSEQRGVPDMSFVCLVDP